MAELIAEKRGEKKGFFTAWLRCKLSFSALLCLRGTRSSRTHRDLGNTDFENVVRKFYQELLKENSNPRLKGNRKGIIVKGKEFYIPTVYLTLFPQDN